MDWFMIFGSTAIFGVAMGIHLSTKYQPPKMPKIPSRFYTLKKYYLG